MGYIDTPESLQMLIPSIFSMMGTLFVFVTCAVFPDLRKLKYIEMVFYIAICDFITCLGMSFGDVSDWDSMCYLQSILTNFSILAGVAWTTFMSHELCSVIRNREGVQNLYLVHGFCWGFPLLCSFIAFVTSISTGDTWCFVSNPARSGDAIMDICLYLTFFVWLWLGILLIFIFFTMAIVRLLQERILFSGRGVKKSLKGLLAYPIILMICWIIPTAINIERALNDAQDKDYNPMARVSPALQGFLVSLVFASRQSVYKSWLGVFVKTRRRTLSLLRIASNTAIDDEEVYKPSEDPDANDDIWKLSFSSGESQSRAFSSRFNSLYSERGRATTKDTTESRETGFGVRPSATGGEAQTIRPTMSPMHSATRIAKMQSRSSNFSDASSQRASAATQTQTSTLSSDPEAPPASTQIEQPKKP